MWLLGLRSGLGRRTGVAGQKRLAASAVAAFDANGQARRRGDGFVQEIALLTETRDDLAVVSPQMLEGGADADVDDDRFAAFRHLHVRAGSAAKKARQ